MKDCVKYENKTKKITFMYMYTNMQTFASFSDLTLGTDLRGLSIGFSFTDESF